MGWLFGRKNKLVPKVPLPEGKPFDEKAFSFPQKMPPQKVIEPNKVKAAVGFDKPISFPEEVDEQKNNQEKYQKKDNKNHQKDYKKDYKKDYQKDQKKEVVVPTNNFEKSPKEFLKGAQNIVKTSSEIKPFFDSEGPQQTFIRIDVYQNIISEIEALNEDLSNLSSIQKKMDTSEYNEEQHFNKLKREIKSLHDNFLQIDKILFKSEVD